METTERVKFTEGPWVARESYQSGEPSGWTVEPGIADIFDPSTAEANARLIAASPTLYGNAYEAVGMINLIGEELAGVPNIGPVRSKLVNLMALLNEGIRAAEGR